jgi:hypothetical protein
MTTAPTPGYAGFARIFWMFVGPMVLVMIAFQIATTESDGFSGADFAFFLVLGGMIFGRWAEFRGGSPQTANGEPATPGHLHRYIKVALPIGLAMWVVAKLIGHFLSGG